MPLTIYERRRREWERYVAAIPYAVRRYAESPLKPSALAVDKYRAGLERHARIMERATTPHTERKR